MVTTNENKVDLQPALILHQRAYRDTSAIVEFFTRDYGRISLLARGAKGKKSPFRGTLQPFAHVLISWQGRGELKTLTHIEQQGAPLMFGNDELVCALYLNELLLRLLPKFDPYQELFVHYLDALDRLASKENSLITLRQFEIALLEELGYELNLRIEANSGEEISADAYYYFLPDQGPVRANIRYTGDRETFRGDSLLAIANRDWDVPHCLDEAKRVTRLALRPLLGSKPLKTRELAVSLSRQRTKTTP